MCDEKYAEDYGKILYELEVLYLEKKGVKGMPSYKELPEIRKEAKTFAVKKAFKVQEIKK